MSFGRARQAQADDANDVLRRAPGRAPLTQRLARGTSDALGPASGASGLALDPDALAAQHQAQEAGLATAMGFGAQQPPIVQRHAASASHAVVQRKESAKKPTKADEKKAHDEFEASGPVVVYALAGVFRNSRSMMESMPSRYADAMHKLHRVVHGDGKWGHEQALDGRERRALLDEVFPIFEPFARNNAHFGGDDDNLPAELNNLRSAVVAAEAHDRVEHAIVLGEGKDKKAMDMPGDGHPREQAQALKAVLPTLLDAIQKVIRRATTQGAGTDEDMLKHLLDAQATLASGASFLDLSDDEVRLHLDKIKVKFNGVATYSDLVKTFLKITSSAIAYTCKASGLLMKVIGDKAMAHICETTAESVSQGFGQVIAAVQIVHGVSVFLDKNASTDDKVGAGVEIAGGIAVIATGEAGAALPITGPYMLVKGAQYLYSEAVLGWETDLVRGAFQHMQRDAHLIGQAMEHLAAAQLLQHDEKDPERKAALAAEEKVRTQQLLGSIKSFLRDTEHRDHGPGNIYEPGNIQIISDAFAGPRNHVGEARTPAEIIALAHEVSKQIAWCFARGPAIVKATATNKTIVEVDGIEQKLENDAKKK